MSFFRKSVILLSSSFAFGLVFAVENDCGFVAFDLTLQIESGFLLNPLHANNVYPNEAYHRALLNLKAYCCETHILSDEQFCAKDKDKFVETYPESLYFYDHLVDVGLRRLDVLNSYEDVPLDTKGAEWRQEISKVSTQEASFALWVEQLVQKYWGVKNDDYPYALPFFDWSVFHLYDEYKLRSLVSDMNYSKRNVYQRYQDVCGMSASLYLWQRQNKSRDLTATLQSDFEVCQAMVNQRILDEMLYAKTIIQNQATKLLMKSINVYAVEYYWKEKLFDLLDTALAVWELFTTVAKIAPAGTATCN